MEEIIKEYLKSIENNKSIGIYNIDFDGSNCFVNYYTDNDRNYTESMKISIWTMVLFLNNKNKTK